ncbi:hypothetical protein [Inquilinus limosus]|uniref:hypothetical protein n=1 Tax=Inquilinus limosus TaxID=171674 RepID=UPI0004285E07|nr:hypothetical protein [Inquilinus limosus]
MPAAKKLTQQEAALLHGFRSGLEEDIAAFLKQEGVAFDYEAVVIPYTKPEKKHKYTPDWFLHNGIILESKGRWTTDDRQKMALVKSQYPELDIRMVFSNPNARISKASQTTYAMVCMKLGIPFAAKKPPLAWLKEPPNKKSLAVIMELLKPSKGGRK